MIVATALTTWLAAAKDSGGMERPSEPAIGIDLGTTYSVIAVLDSTGRPQTIQNAEGEATTPSAILFDESSVTVGKEAVRAAALEPDRIAEFAKREMGNPSFSKAINGEHFPPEVIQSFVLEKLKIDAEKKLGPFRKAVITVPAYFNEPRRKATQDAGHLAGLEVLDIINEPTAAAITFGVQQGFLTQQATAITQEKLLVYDLGGGTFDVTLMEIDGSSYTALATAGDVYLGGIDWNWRLVDHVVEQFKSKYGLDLRLHPGAFHRLMQAAEEAKRALTAREQTAVIFEHSGDGIRVPISRSEFESMTSDLLERTRLTVRNVLRDAHVEWKDITRLLLVGGATRMPMVQQMLKDESGKDLDCTLSADEAVAHGASIYAGLLLGTDTGSRQSITVRNVNSHDLGVLGVEPETGRPRRKIMIPRNTPLPFAKTGKFVTHKDNQAAVVVKIVEGGDDAGHNATPIGQCVVHDLPPNLPAGSRVDVKFRYEQNGRLQVAAMVPNAERTASLTLERSSGLSDAMRDEWYETLRKRSGPLKLN